MSKCFQPVHVVGVFYLDGIPSIVTYAVTCERKFLKEYKARLCSDFKMVFFFWFSVACLCRQRFVNVHCLAVVKLLSIRACIRSFCSIFLLLGALIWT